MVVNRLGALSYGIVRATALGCMKPVVCYATIEASALVRWAMTEMEISAAT